MSLRKIFHLEIKSERGGKREGAGRKPSPYPTKIIYKRVDERIYEEAKKRLEEIVINLKKDLNN
jgi:hypothetical protein